MLLLLLLLTTAAMRYITDSSRLKLEAQIYCTNGPSNSSYALRRECFYEYSGGSVCFDPAWQCNASTHY
ncbi:hypothetical protein JOB18_033564, partial [Solea senegalensis]